MLVLGCDETEAKCSCSGCLPTGRTLRLLGGLLRVQAWSGPYNNVKLRIWASEGLRRRLGASDSTEEGYMGELASCLAMRFPSVGGLNDAPIYHMSTP